MKINTDIIKKIEELTALLPHTSKYSQGTKTDSEIFDVMQRSIIWVLSKAIKDNCFKVEVLEAQQSVIFEEQKDLVETGKAKNVNGLRKAHAQLKATKSYNADWTDALAQIDGLMDDYKIDYKAPAYLQKQMDDLGRDVVGEMERNAILEEVKSFS
tara:strand:+ start:76 stop:543 length:468 start_codon:yes stop_codon:yes gene_type:complete